MTLNYPMRSNGMYILKKTDFDDIAEKVLLGYMPDILVYPKPTDIEYLAKECLYLDIKYESIDPDGTILGMIAFDKTEYSIIEDYNEVKKIKLELGTMLVNMCLIGNDNRPRKKFTVAHETAHWICHRSYHSPDNRQFTFRINRNLIACRTNSIEQYNKKQQNYSDEDWEEWQADSLAAALLMPKRTFLDACRNVLWNNGVYKCYLTSKDNKHVAHRVISEMAHIFDVSFRAAQIRMINLGFIKF